jgi:hypothetical protein
MLRDCLAYGLGEILVFPVTTRESDECEAGRKKAAGGEVVDGRHDLLAGEISGDTEQHDGARSGHSR